MNHSKKIWKFLLKQKYHGRCRGLWQKCYAQKCYALRLLWVELSAQHINAWLHSILTATFYDVPHHLFLQMRKPRLDDLCWKLDLISKCTAPNASVFLFVFQSLGCVRICVCVCVCVCQTFMTGQTVACQVPLSMAFSRQEHWSG